MTAKQRRIRRSTRRIAGRLALIGVVATAGIATAAMFSAPAEVDTPAVRVVTPLGDVVAVFDIEDVDRAVVEASFAVAEQSGAAAAPALTASMGMQRLTRAGAVVHAPPAGYLIPIVISAMPRAAVVGVVGNGVSSLLDDGSAVMNEVTAQIMGAQAGDVIEMRAANGSTQAFTISGIRPYSQVGGAELVMTDTAAARLGLVESTRMLIWGIDSRDAVDAALQTSGLLTRKDTRVDRSWLSAGPDDTLSTPRTKQLVGEPVYRIVSGDVIEMHPTWMAANLPSGRVLLNSSIPIRARCHVNASAEMGAALADIAAAGLGGAIDVTNTNTYGGCFNARYSRSSGFLSRHAYGLALDMNTTTNCMGCVPKMNCDVVRIFRRHGFAWGGNFRQPDGMHFEWVGERRDLMSYPSKYCPNVVNPMTERLVAPEPLGNEVLTSGFESMLTHDH